MQKTKLLLAKKQEKMFWYKVRLIDCNEDQRSEAEDLKTEVYEVLNKPPIRQNEDFYEKLRLSRRPGHLSSEAAWLYCLRFIMHGGRPLWDHGFGVIEYSQQREKERRISTKFTIYYKSIELEVEFMKLTFLQDLTALEISKRVKDIEKLYKVIPRQLVSEVKKFR